MRPGKFVIGLALPLASALALVAGPPLETDDPDTPGAGHWELNFASSLEKRLDLWTINPLLDVNYGWGERVQLKLKPRAVAKRKPGGGSQAGAGNIQLGVKWRFLDEANGGLGMSVYPQADFNPPGRSVSDGLVDEGHALFLPVQISRTFSRTRLYAEAGHDWRERRTDRWAFGVAAEHPLHRRFRLVAELRDLAQKDLRDHELFFNAGFKWQLHQRWTVLASAGRTLHRPRDEVAGVFSYLGLQFVF